MIWSPTVGEENRLRRFENRVLRILFGPKEDEIICNGGDSKMKKLHDLYYSPGIIGLVKSRKFR